MSALLASVHLDRPLAEFALDAAAPVELAPTSLGHQLPRGRVPAPAAHQVAAVRARRLAVAPAAARSRRSDLRIGITEAAGRRNEDEVVAGGTVEGAVALDQSGALSVEHDLRGGVVAVAQPVPGLAEAGQLVPTRSDAARTGHAVALAAHLGVPVHRLQTHTHIPVSYTHLTLPTKRIV